MSASAPVTCCTMRRKVAASVLMYVVGARFDGRGRRFPVRPPGAGPSCCCCLQRADGGSQIKAGAGAVAAAVLQAKTDWWSGSGEQPETEKLSARAMAASAKDRESRDAGGAAQATASMVQLCRLRWRRSVSFAGERELEKREQIGRAHV